MSQLGNGKHLLDPLIRGLLWQNSTHAENISNCEQTWILSCVRSIVNRLMSLHDRWVCFGPWFHVGYIHVLETKANFRDHVFFLSEPNTVAKALLQDFRDFRRPEPKSYSAALGASTAHSCWRQWGSGAKSHVSSRLYSGYHVRRFLSQWYHSVSLCHCVIVLLLKGSTRRFCEIELGVGAIQTISPQSCLYGLKFRSRRPLILASFSIQKYNFEVPEVPILIHTFIAFTFTFPPPQFN